MIIVCRIPHRGRAVGGVGEILVEQFEALGAGELVALVHIDAGGPATMMVRRSVTRVRMR